MTASLKARYDAFAERLLSSLSEIEREDVKSFDRWFDTSGWRWLAAIVAVTTACAWFASNLPWNMSFVEATILFNLVVLSLLWSGLAAWFGYRKFSGRVFRYVLAGPLLALLGVVALASIGGFVQRADPFAWMQDSAKLRHLVIAGIVFAFLYAGLVALIAVLRNREYRALAAHLEAEREQSELSRKLAESRLRMLQLQVEPHFLFNTLGSAQQLAEKGAPEAARLIANLIRFLRAATPALREESATLVQERVLVEAYLGIMRTRLGRRLEFVVDVPAALERVVVPPGMLITLVENAVKHGIEPSAAGGRVEVRASAASGGRIELEVADTGAGPGGAAKGGQGVGLANIRERLALLYGEDAALELRANEPTGFVARIRLPARHANAATTHPTS